MLNEQQQDGHLIYYEPAMPIGRSKLLLHVNGVSSSVDKQARDLEALVWLTLEQPMDVIGIHNSTAGFQVDLVESYLGKAELYHFWPEHQTADSRRRLQGYQQLLTALCQEHLAADADILQVVQQLRSKSLTTLPQDVGQPIFSLDLIRRLPLVAQMDWSEFASYFYGSFPAGAPRPTLRLAYEMIKGIRAGAEVFVVAHSQGMIIAAIALHIVQAFFGNYDKWIEMVRLIGYGPAIMFSDIPPLLRPQTVMVQHRQDLVAEALSNIRNVDYWSNIQSQLQNILEQSDRLSRLINTDSHHSASVYLGLREDPAGTRSAALIKLLLTQSWASSPLVQALRASRIILEESSPVIP